MQQVNYKKQNIDFLEKVSFVLFLLSIIMYISQGLVAVLGEQLRSILHMPPQVALVFLSATCFLERWRVVKWFLKGRGRLPVVLGFFSLIFILIHDLPIYHNFEDLERVFQLLTGLLIYFVAFQITYREEWIRYLIQAIFITVCISSLVAIIEFFSGIEMPWSTYNEITIGYTHGTTGLEGSPVSLSYSTITPLVMACLFTIIKEKTFAYPGYILSLITSIMGFLSLIVSASRSGILGLIIGIIGGIFLIGNKKQFITTLILFSLFLIFLYSPLAEYFGKSNIKEETRIINNFIVYFPMLILNPFGVDVNKPIDYIYSSTNETLSLSQNYEISNSVLTLAPHNGFLTLGIIYGIIPFISLIIIYTYCIIIGYKSIKKPLISFQLKLFIIYLISGIIALIVHSWFHNATIFIGEMRNWLYLGILVQISFRAKGIILIKDLKK